LIFEHPPLSPPRRPTSHDLHGINHLDLSDEDEPVKPAFVNALVALTGKLAHGGARLIVIATEKVWLDPSGVALPTTVRLGRPDAREILALHLRLLTGDESWRNTVKQPLLDVVTTLTRPVDAVAVARAAATISEPDVLQNEVEHIASWPSFLREHFDTLAQPSDRDASADTKLLLVAGAVSDGRTTGSVYATYDALLTAVGAPRDPFRTLTAPGFTNRLTLLNADVRADQVHLTASRPGVDVAVLKHFWREYPMLRPQTLKWMCAVVNLPGYNSRDTDRLGSLLVAMAVVADHRLVLDAVSKWSTGTGREGALATAVLTPGLDDDDLRPSILNVLRGWAQSSSSVQQQMVAEMCRGGKVQPQRALIRLKWILCKPADVESVRKAGEALRALASESRDTAITVLNTIQSWADRWPAAAGRGFLHLLANNDGIDVAANLLRQAATDIELRRALLDGWVRAWKMPHDVDGAADGLSTWSSAIDAGRLDHVAEELLVEAILSHLKATRSLDAVLPSRDHPGPARDTARFRILRRATDTFLAGTNESAVSTLIEAPDPEVIQPMGTTAPTEI
jgi:hypothetical protein